MYLKFASGISKIGRYIFLEILFWRRFFANGIHCVRGSHKLTVRVTISRHDVSSSSAFFYWFFYSYEILWKLCFEQTMHCSQHHWFLSSLFSLQKEGILTLHACQSRTKSWHFLVRDVEIPDFFYYVLQTTNLPLVNFFTFSQIEV